MDHPFSPSSVPRILPPMHTRTPSRSPTRLRIVDDILSDLSPATTLEAFTNPSGRLRASIEATSPTERVFGIQAAFAAKKILEWVDELSAWPWPREGGSLAFLMPSKEGPGLSNPTPSERLGPQTKPLYLGSILRSQVEAYVIRINLISAEMEELNIEEIKRQVKDNHISPKSRPSSSGLNTQTPSFLSSYTRLEDFTAIVTKTVLRALLDLNRLTRLMDIWTARLIVLREVPSLMFDLQDAEVALQSGWSTITKHNSAGGLPAESFAIMQYTLQDKIVPLGKKFDFLQDTLAGSMDTLPDSWIDRMIDLEDGYADWVVAAERQVILSRNAVLEAEEDIRRKKKEAEDALQFARLKAEEEAEELSRLELQKKVDEQAKLKAEAESAALEASRLQAEQQLHEVTILKSQKEAEEVRAAEIAQQNTQKEVENEASDIAEPGIKTEDARNIKSHVEEQKGFDADTLGEPVATVAPLPNTTNLEAENHNDFTHLSEEPQNGNAVKPKSQPNMVYGKTAAAGVGVVAGVLLGRSRGNSPVHTESSKDLSNAYDSTPFGDSSGDDENAAPVHVQPNTVPNALAPPEDDILYSTRTSKYPLFDGSKILDGSDDDTEINPASPSIVSNESRAQSAHITSPSHIPIPQTASQPNISLPNTLSQLAEPTDDINRPVLLPEKQKTESGSSPRRSFDSSHSDTPFIPTQSLNPLAQIPYLPAPVDRSASYDNYTKQNISNEEAPGEEPSHEIQSNDYLPSDYSPSNHSSQSGLNSSFGSDYDLYKSVIDDNSRLVKDVEPVGEFESPDVNPLEDLEAVDEELQPTEIENVEPVYVQEVDLDEVKSVEDDEVKPGQTVPSHPDRRGSNLPLILDTDELAPSSEAPNGSPQSLRFAKDSKDNSSDTEMSSVPAPFLENYIGNNTASTTLPEIQTGDSTCEVCDNFDQDADSTLLESNNGTIQPLKPSNVTRISSPDRPNSVSSDKTVITYHHEESKSSASPYLEDLSTSSETEEPSPSVGRTGHRNQNSYDISPPGSPSAPAKRKPKVLALLKSPEFSSSGPSSPTTPIEAPIFDNVDVSTTQILTSPKKASTDEQMQQQISELLESIPARIHLKTETKSAPFTSETLRPLKTRRSVTPSLRSSSSLSNYSTTSRAPTPSFTLTPAYGKGAPRPRHQVNNPEIKVYHLSHSTGKAPIKLFVRLVGERGERVMVRVGGGWADLGEYLKEYASHHGRRTGAEGDNVEVQDLTHRVISSTGTRNSSAATIRGNGRASPMPPRPASSLDGERAGGLNIRKTRKSAGHSSHEASAVPGRMNDTRAPSTPLPTTSRRHFDTPPSASSVGTATSGRSSRMGWDEEDSSLGLAGPKSKKVAISERDQEWVDSMKEKVRLASAEKERKEREKVERGERERGASFGEMGKVGGTKRLFKKGDL